MENHGESLNHDGDDGVEIQDIPFEKEIPELSTMLLMIPVFAHLSPSQVEP